MATASIKKTYSLDEKTKNMGKLIKATNNVKPHKYTTPIKKVIRD